MRLPAETTCGTTTCARERRAPRNLNEDRRFPRLPRESGPDREREDVRGTLLNRSFDEVQVFAGVAERTGVHIDRAGVRGHGGVCRSLGELNAKSRRLGDGYYYLASSVWPEDAQSVNLARAWTALG